MLTMRTRKLLPDLLFTMIVLGLVLMAFDVGAQVVVPTPAPVTVLNTSGVVITILAVLAGYVTKAVNTGTFLGMVTIPKAWLPYLTLGGTFFLAFVFSLTASSNGGINEVGLFNAGLAGFLALLGNTVGATARDSLTAHLRLPTFLTPQAKNVAAVSVGASVPPPPSPTKP